MQQARVREKIWVLETTGNLTESGRRSSGAASDGPLRGVRLLCLEKAYTFTQYLVRSRAKRLLLRVFYCWGSMAAARTMLQEGGGSGVSRVVPLVEQSTWTGPVEEEGEVLVLRLRLQQIEQDAAATAERVRHVVAHHASHMSSDSQPQQQQEVTEHDVLVTSLAICRQRVHALELKVEELLAVEQAYRRYPPLSSTLCVVVWFVIVLCGWLRVHVTVCLCV